MPLRFIARYIMNHPEIIDKLASSYPFRRAAQLGASLFFRGQGASTEVTKTLANWLEKNGYDKSSVAKFFGSKPTPLSAKGDVAIDKLKRLKQVMDEMQRKQLK